MVKDTDEMERNRRDFLRVGAAAAGGVLAGCQGLIGRDPPEPVVRNVSVEEPPVAEEHLTVSARIENPGTSEQRTTVTFFVDGDAVANRTVAIEGESTRSVAVTHRFETPGDHALAVNDGDVRSVSVVPPVRIRSATIEHEAVATGQPATVVVSVENRGSNAHEGSFSLTADGDTVVKKTADIPGGQRTTITLEPTFHSPGQRSVALNDDRIGSITVTESITLTGLGLEKETVPIGHILEITATAENVTAERSRRTVTVTADGSEVTSHTIELAPMAERTVAIAVPVPTTGEHTLAVDGTSVGTARVTPSWRQFANGPGNTGRARETHAPGSEIQTAWTHSVMEGSASVPAVVGDTVYWGTGNPYGAADNGRLFALSTDGGSVRWSIDAGGRVHGTPAVTQGVVVADTSTGRLSEENVDGTVIGVDAADGTERFTVDTGPIRGSPVVSGERVYVASQETILALDPNTGQRHWEQPLSDWGGGIALRDGTVYSVGWSGIVRALDTSDGSEQWQTELPNPIAGPPTVTDDSLYTATRRGDSALYALDAATGDRRWRSPQDGLVSPTVAVGETGLFTAVGLSMYAFEQRDGSVRWRGPDSDAGSLDPGVAAVTDGTVYTGAGRVNGGVLFAFDAASGDVQWRTALDISSESVTVQNGTIYAPTGFGTLSALSDPQPN